MKYGLLDYAARNPAQGRPPEQEQAKSQRDIYRERKEAIQEAEALKESIAQQLEQGTAPQYVLYTAIKAIGLFADDPEWTEAQNKILDGVYADLAQESLFIDNAAIAAGRLEEMQQSYNDKMRKQLQTSLNSYRRIEKALQDALQAVNDAKTVKEPNILK